MRSVIAALAMENELLPRRIRRMENQKPFLRLCRANEPCPAGLPAAAKPGPKTHYTDE